MKHHFKNATSTWCSLLMILFALGNTAGRAANLPAPTLLAPSNSATNVSLPVTFSWTVVSGANSGYRIMVATSSAVLPTDPTVSACAGCVINDTPTGTTYSTSALSSGQTYYWEVHGRSTTLYGTWSSKFVFTTKAVLSAPSLSFPGNGASGVASPVTLSWGAATGATSYDVYLGTSSSPGFLANTSGTSYGPVTISAGTTYYWKVVARNSSGGTASSAVFGFATQAALSAPTLSAPGNGTSGLTSPVTLNWNAANGASSYDVYLGTSSSPGFLANTSGTHYGPVTISAGATYYWKIVARNTSGGTASSGVFVFTTQAALSAPLLSTPGNGVSGITSPVTLTWSAATGAASYDVYLGTSSSPGFLANTSATNYGPITASAGTAYYWKIVSKNTSGATASSGVFSFTTQAAALASPSLLSPNNGATNITQPVTFSWAAVSGANSGYRIMVAANSAALPTDPTASSCSGCVINDTPPGTTYSTSALSPGQTYYWEVHGRSSADYGTWSLKFSFSTQGASTAANFTLFDSGKVSSIDYLFPEQLDPTKKQLPYTDAQGGTHTYHVYTVANAVGWFGASSLSPSGFRILLRANGSGSVLSVEVPSGVQAAALQLILPFGLNVQSVSGINAQLGMAAPNGVADGLSCSFKAVVLDTLSDALGPAYTAGEVVACTGLLSIPSAGEACSPSQPIINSRSLPCLLDQGNNTLYGDKVLNTHQIRNVVFRPTGTAVNISRVEFGMAEPPNSVTSLIGTQGVTLYVTTAIGDYWLDNFR